jgi:hypothetical protein
VVGEIEVVDMGAHANVAPVIIKRKKVIKSGGHHGGAWKVAYADFVTAMMAFFMLMWLLNATTETQKRGSRITFRQRSQSIEFLVVAMVPLEGIVCFLKTHFPRLGLVRRRCARLNRTKPAATRVLPTKTVKMLQLKTRSSNPWRLRWLVVGAKAWSWKML